MGVLDQLDDVIDALGAGRLVVVPTDTVYGVAALPTVPGAMDRLFEAKGRAADVPVAVLCGSVDQALGLADGMTAVAESLAEQCWPGALTLVLSRRRDLGWQLGEPTDTIGVRVPDHALIAEVCAAVGPIATTSANRHGEPTPVDAADAAASLLVEPAVVVDAGPLSGAASTVVDARGPTIRILRQGAVVVG